MPKGKRHTPEQIVAILRRAESGEAAATVCRETNISTATFHRWKRQYGGMELLTQADVVRKQRAAVAWCARVNGLPPEQRGGREWSYCLLGEAVFHRFRDEGAAMEELLQFSRVRERPGEVGMLFG